ncbi:toll/interleukin-1 receptor domain-containing protein [Paraglaciecola chathamensis]|uniref:Toll-Interleukin receptor n=1 Tax=Paraglaciecola agarilytica NO2 TaxID=1125747 RepID=A0ABQ0I1R5_9ALTE|nr:toll/interleukin-1 receptor domain-containing protein [Paraglaciecola agarilytica]GAC03275.1 Toll-Interleukin receptor [Paraglaciecola agarilytica NO2]
MIFISYNHNDSELVNVIANKLSDIFTTDKIFFDRWSIQPGDGIIDKMNTGLGEAKFMFFFVSKNSLSSKMVSLEWQNALLKSTKGQIKLIPVKIDDCLMPDILFQSLYIDLFGKGLDVAFRQILDIIEQKKPDTTQKKYENVRAKVSSNGSKTLIEFFSVTYMEPQASFAIALANTQDEFKAWEKDSPSFQSAFRHGDKVLDNGTRVNVLTFQRDNPLSPGFPYILELTQLKDKKVEIVEAFHASDSHYYRVIPKS